MNWRHWVFMTSMLAGCGSSAYAADATAVISLNNDGVNALKVNNYAVAIEKFKAALKVDPGYQMARDNLGIAHNNYGLQLRNDPKAALKQFHQAAYLNRSNPTTEANIEGMIKIMGRNPHSFKDRVELGDQASNTADFIGAIIEYSEALKIGEDSIVRANLTEANRAALDENYKPKFVYAAASSQSPTAVHSEPAASSLSPEAQRFETAKHLRQRALTILSLRAAEDTADKVWQEWHPPANGKLLITKVRLTLDADGKMSACKVVASSGSEPEDKSVQDCLSGTTFKPLPVGITSLDLFWTLMSDGTMNMVESTDSPEADAYNRNLIGGIFRPAGINAPVYGLSNTGVSSRAIGVQADVDFGPYMADLQRRIKRAWFPPKGSESKRVIVVFKVHKGGELSNLRLDKSSAVAVADQAGLEAVQRASPFRPLPAGASDSVGIQFTFDYNVFNGGGHGTFISY